VALLENFHQTLGHFRIKTRINLAFAVLENEIFGLDAGQANGRTGAATKAGKNGSFRILIQLQFIFNGESCDGISSPGRIRLCLLNQIGGTTWQAKSALIAFYHFIVGQFF